MVDQLETLFPQSESSNPSSPEVPPLQYVSLKLGFCLHVQGCPVMLLLTHRILLAVNLCEAVKAMSHLINEAANCSLATKELYTFCSR